VEKRLRGKSVAFWSFCPTQIRTSHIFKRLRCWKSVEFIWLHPDGDSIGYCYSRLVNFFGKKITLSLAETTGQMWEFYELNDCYGYPENIEVGWYPKIIKNPKLWSVGQTFLAPISPKNQETLIRGYHMCIQGLKHVFPYVNGSKPPIFASFSSIFPHDYGSKPIFRKFRGMNIHNYAPLY